MINDFFEQILCGYYKIYYNIVIKLFKLLKKLTFLFS